MLIACPECGREISDQAPACPGCGRPQQAQTIERTAKPLKLHMICAAGTLALSLAVGWYGLGRADAEDAGPLVVGSAVSGIGAGVWLLVVRLRSWWEHG